MRKGERKEVLVKIIDVDFANILSIFNTTLIFEQFSLTVRQQTGKKIRGPCYPVEKITYAQCRLYRSAQNRVQYPRTPKSLM